MIDNYFPRVYKSHMPKTETDPIDVKPAVEERRSRYQHERDVVLALADPGKVNESGVLQKPTHREIAERFYARELSKLGGRKRTIRLAAATQSVRNIGRRFIGKLNNLARLKREEFAKTTALFEDVKELYPERVLAANDLYEIFGIAEDGKESGFGSWHQSSNITAPPLPQPETDPKKREIDVGAFVDHLMDLRRGETVVYIGTKLDTDRSK